ncbi:MAG: transcription-repair coupling factor [Clostridia bacterium]|nr:transcription-repair coupling factor [Clostridia bacterium]
MKLPQKFLANNLSNLINKLRSRTQVSVFGLNLGERVLISAQTDDFLCYVAENENIAKLVAQDLTTLGKKVALLTNFNDDFTFHLMEFGNAGVTTQVELNKIINNEVNACVITPEILCTHFAPKKVWQDSLLQIEDNQDIAIDDLIAKLTSCGYTRVDAVESVGQFAVRGDVLDVFPINSELPFRLHFFDTIIEKISTFNVITQFSIQKEQKVTICPNAFKVSEQEIQNIKQILDSEYSQAQKRVSKVKHPNDFLQNIENLKFIKDSLKDYIPRNAWAFLSAFTQTENFLQLLPSETLIVIDQPKQCNAKYNEFLDNIKTNINQNLETGQLLPLHKNLITDFDDFTHTLSDFKAVAFQSIMTQNKFFNPKDLANFETLPLPKLKDDYKLFADHLHEFTLNAYRVVLCASEPASAEEFYNKLKNYIACEKISNINDAMASRVNILVSPLVLGACFTEDKLLILGSNETKYTRAKNKTWEKQMLKVTDRFTLPEVGEYVVHAIHGIGICEGITQLSVGGAKRDYVVVSYKNNDRLYIPTEQLDMLGRYIGSDKSPTLSAIGGTNFEKAKQRVRESVKQLAFDLLALYREREKSQGNIMKVDESTMAEFEASFGYTPTPDQESAFNDVYNDLASGKIMDRLVVGDVGFGKTEVAIRASFVAVMSGFQVAVIVPTTILSEQHYNTFSARLKNYGIEVRCLNRFKSPKEQKKIIEEVRQGKVNILIGTHRLLSKDVEFDNLGLLVLDEEQRFGVGDKEKLKNVKKNIHVLTLSATPIPRTLHISLVGIRDISTIETPPLDRLPVQTIVSQFSYGLISTAIRRELARGGQALVVYPRVDNIDAFAQSLRAELGQDVRIGVAHGQMEKSKIEEVILALYQGDIDCLVATTLIENGVDLPNANTLFVVSADKLGLSQLYQLRGRVGRSNQLAYAYFTYMDEGKLSSTAYERLSVLMQFTALGSGFKIAMRDLELRGAGNVLGPEQHGQMEKVGYDLYCKLLNSSIAMAKGEAVQEFKPVKIEVDIDAFVPDKFETDKIKRMEIYSAIANIANDNDAQNVTEQIQDKYGFVPNSIEGLIKVATLKAKCQVLGIERVSVTKQKTNIYIPQSKTDLVNCATMCAGKDFIVYKKDSMVIISHSNQNISLNIVWTQVFDYLNELLAKCI